MADDSNNPSPKESPLIENIRWGVVKVKGYPEGKDCKLYPGGAEEWDWTKTNTHHKPGIQLQDVEDLLNNGAEIIILSMGMNNQLETSDETKNHLDKLNMKLDETYFIKQTDEAVKLYNQFVEEKKAVGALIHSTC